MPETPTLAEVIRRAWDARMLDVHTSMPGMVVSYDAATQTADVQPMLRRPMRDQDGERVVEELPVVPGVPVLFPRTASAFVSLPIAAGDFVLLAFCEGSIDAWRGTGDVADPGDERRHNLSHAVAIPGVYPAAQALGDAHSTNVVIGHDGGTQIHVQPGGSGGVLIGGAAAAEPMILGQTLVTWLLAHVHPAPGGTTSAPTNIPGPTDLNNALSANHRIDQ